MYTRLAKRSISSLSYTYDKRIYTVSDGVNGYHLAADKSVIVEPWAMSNKTFDGWIQHNDFWEVSPDPDLELDEGL